MNLPIPAIKNTFSMRTGVASLRSLPPRDLLNLTMLRLDSNVFCTPIVHEVLHHACANSAVNIAMQYRWLELLRLVLSSPGFGYAVYEDHIELAADLAAAEAVLQPFAEGIANFAEFDCVVPDSRTIHRTGIGMVDALMWRILACKLNGKNHVDDFWSLLCKEQLDAKTLKRKRDVLCFPTYPNSGEEVYLLGYLAIKSLWNKFSEADPTSWLRPSSFLSFVLDYFYEDWTLAAILTTPGRIPIDRMLDRLITRWESLLQSDLAKNAIAFTNDMRQRTGARGTLMRGPEELEHGSFQGLDLSAEEVSRGMRTMMAFYQKWVGPCGAVTGEHETPKGIVNLQHEMLTEPRSRSIPAVAAYAERHRLSEPCDIRVLDLVLEIPQRKRPHCYLLEVEVEIKALNPTQVVVTIPGNPESAQVLSMANTKYLTAGQCEGRLFAVISSTDVPWRLHCFLMHEDRVVALWKHGEENTDPGEYQQILSTIATEIQMEQATQLSFRSIQRYLTANELAGNRVSDSDRKATMDVAEQLRRVLGNHGWSGLMANDFEFGLKDIVGRDLDCLAAAGICASFTSARPDLEGLILQAGYRLEDALEASERAYRKTGLTLIHVNGDHVLVRI